MTTSRRFIAAALQMCSTSDLQTNLATCKRLAAKAAQRGASLLVLPENFAFLGQREHDKLAVAEAIDPRAPGPILSALMEIATSQGAWVIGGGMPERIGGAEAATRTYNTCVTIDPGGHIAAIYRKIHLFDVDIPGHAVHRESDSTAAGTEPVVCATPMARIGMSVCYDLRFPELYRDLVLRRGAQLVVVPAAFTAHTGAAHWHVLLRSRAVENQCYVVAAAQSGRHNEKRVTYGHSMIIDPWGTILDERPEGEGVVLGAIDPEVLDRTRRQMPCLQHQVLLG
jgi:deaminated glutathione amidase